ncbi:hypothetical protein CYMTET_54492 [Cymbomonas tetramitiformis]|uniref:Uncharacterized protein n=1 Tax=Cymbomonas tetramitiformis TaxID=36881 RepID=A0AAE0ENZ0_9CHLO|nr:hypothetical protein CYMTET_54492 [Cymbomonas tetramitiformis]
MPSEAVGGALVGTAVGENVGRNDGKMVGEAEGACVGGKLLGGSVSGGGDGGGNNGGNGSGLGGGVGGGGEFSTTTVPLILEDGKVLAAENVATPSKTVVPTANPHSVISQLPATEHISASEKLHSRADEPAGTLTEYTTKVLMSELRPVIVKQVELIWPVQYRLIGPLPWSVIVMVGGGGLGGGGGAGGGGGPCVGLSVGEIVGTVVVGDMEG